MSIWSNGLMILFRSLIFTVFGLLDLSVTDRDVLKSPNIIVYLYLSIPLSVLLVIASHTLVLFC